MWIERRAALFAAILAAGPAVAQAPLSAIDWLSDSIAQPVVLPPPPPDRDVAVNALPEEVTVAPLGAIDPDRLGLVPAADVGLPRDLWGGAAATRLARLLTRDMAQSLPSMRALARDLAVARTEPPTGATGEAVLFTARVDTLLQLGALDDARRLLDLAERDNPAFFRRWFDIALLQGTETRACGRMRALPEVSPTYSARIFCLARGGDWPAAALTLETAVALGVLGGPEEELIVRFLDPELADVGTPLPPPRQPTPLEFAMYDAIGEPLPTAPLPIAFSHHDLRDVIGWKARIEAAERLAAAGAIPAEALWDTYDERLPAASGGVWDRVAAAQRFALALGRDDAEAVARTLPPLWDHFRDAGLEPVLAAVHGPALARMAADAALDGRAADIALRAALLSPRGRALLAPARPEDPDLAFLAALARGTPEAAPAPGDRAAVVQEAFATEAMPMRLQDEADRGHMGSAILRAMALVDAGAQGNMNALRDGLAALRLLGLSDRAVAAALEFMILEPAR
ncbi:hypothetical protein DXV76_06670 [Rhodobacteraceae bacterium CCMM004]|nr:hypothetical protein DXV76_06670 [Rhodobacteraceae bacterium CCMM004]